MESVSPTREPLGLSSCSNANDCHGMLSLTSAVPTLQLNYEDTSGSVFWRTTNILGSELSEMTPLLRHASIEMDQAKHPLISLNDRGGLHSGRTFRHTTDLPIRNHANVNASQHSAKLSRPRRNFVKPDEWERARPVITELYEKMTLDDVMKEMEKRSFFASKKMFKTRIKKWRIEKKLKACEVVEMVRLREMLPNTSKDMEFNLNGRTVTSADVERYLRRNQKSIAELRLIAAHKPIPLLFYRVFSSGGPRCSSPRLGFQLINVPDSLSNYDRVFVAISNYTKALNVRLWPRETERSKAYSYMFDIRLLRWDNEMMETADLFRTGKATDAFILLGNCLDRTAQVIRSEDPCLLIRMTRSVLRLYYADGPTGAKVVDFIRKLAARILPQQHHIRVFWQYWHDLQNHGLHETLRIMIQPFIENALNDPSHNVGYLHDLVEYYVRARFSIPTRSLRDLERELRSILARLQLECSQTHPSIIRLRLVLAEVLVQRQVSSFEIEAALDDAEAWYSQSDNLLKASVFFDWFWLKCVIFEERKEWKNGYEFCCRLTHHSLEEFPSSAMVRLQCYEYLVKFRSKLHVTELRNESIDLDDLRASYISRHWLESEVW